MNQDDREDLAQEANNAARESRAPGAPTLTATSSIEELCDWLQWDDPNGEHETSGYECIEDAWRMLAALLEGN